MLRILTLVLAAAAALSAADKLRDRFGEGAVGLAAAMKHGRRERVHENPAGLPGKEGKTDESV